MFLLTTVVDTLRVPSSLLSIPTKVAIHQQVDRKYPNRILHEVGLVICRYGDCLSIGDGVCVPGDGGSHYECRFVVVVFRPFVEEVCIGYISKSTPEGVHVTLGFFQDIFIPAYWMLRPSHYEEASGLWVWTPTYDDDDDEGEGDEAAEQAGKTTDNKDENKNTQQEQPEAKEAAEENRFEMEIGAEIRFKVKSINFTMVTNTAKGVQATTTTTAHSKSFPQSTNNTEEDMQQLRKRSSSVELSDTQEPPAPMLIIASICEDGLGLTSWWTGEEESEEEDQQQQGEAAPDGASANEEQDYVEEEYTEHVEEEYAAQDGNDYAEDDYAEDEEFVHESRQATSQADEEDE